ncbi:MAG: hypothetical protein DHS20C16_04490 [Phycisphaerae bacterium]|nr:MAG: hypothetical protein DHS20C16_04490 [Phycisphaerae bacterium]
MKSRFFDISCLVVLLAVVGLRPLVSESFHTSNSANELAPGLHDPVTWHTLLINVVILLTTFTIACRSLFYKGVRVRQTGIELGAMLLLFAAVIACWSAADQRPARLAAIDLLAALALAWGLVQVIKFRWQRVLALSVILASGMVSVAESYDQSFYTMRETEKQYELDRESMWAQKGIALDSPQVTMFENRMRSREASGYFSHSNVFGGYLLLAIFTAAGCALCAYRIRRQTGGVGLVVAYAVLAMLAAFAVYLSNSRGAIVSGVLTLGALGFVIACQSWWAKNRAWVFQCSIGLVIAGIISVATYGVITDGLPGASLDFRWQYWRASSQMFGDHWLTGVGPENFGDAYLKYKTIADAEEVKNPHNALVQIATEYGLPGLLGLILVLLGGAKAYARAAINGDDESDNKAVSNNDGSTVTSYVTCAVLITFGVFSSRIAMLPSQDPAFVAWSLIVAMPAWMIVHGIGALLAKRAEMAVIPKSWWMPALGFALAAFLLQDMINFGFFVPGARTTFAAVFAVTIARVGVVEESDEAQRSVGHWAVPGLLALTLGWAVFEFSRVFPAESALNDARNFGSSGATPDAVNERYLDARRLDPLDGASSVEHARWLMGKATSDAGRSDDNLRRELSSAMGAMNEAISRAPSKYTNYRLASQIHLLRHRVEGEKDAERAVWAMRQALSLYPSRPMSYVELADCLVEVPTCSTLTQAVMHLRRAIELDDARPEWEEVRRFSSRIKTEIEARIQRIEQLIEDHACDD